VAKGLKKNLKVCLPAFCCQVYTKKRLKVQGFSAVSRTLHGVVGGKGRFKSAGVFW
jgi:hypothetical protein